MATSRCPKPSRSCPCHEGFFDERTGEVTAGPPVLPLPRIDVEVRDGMIWALRADPP